MRPRRARSRSISLELTRLEDRTVPSSIVSPPEPPEPPADPIEHDHGGLNTQPTSYFLSTGTTEFLTGPQEGDPTTLALQALQAYAFTLGLSPADAANPIVTDSYSDGAGRMSHVYLRQQLNGLGVINASIGVHLTADGRVITINGGFVPGAAALDSGTGQPPAPGLTATAAVAAAMDYFGVASTGTAEVTSSESDVARTSVLSAPGVAGGKATANLAYANTPNGARLVWELKFGVPGGAHFYHSAVDAETGAVVFWADWVSNLETYNVFPAQQESPLDGPRQFIVDPSDPTASPHGWHDTDGMPGPEFLDTRGNNVFAQEDQDADDFGGARPSGGSGLLFDSPVNFADQPATYVDALITNLFFQNNFLHDVHYAYGFTEAAGNFQENNYGRGGPNGVEGDAVRADAIDGSGINNANFFTPADGVDPLFGPPRMQMFEFFDFTNSPSNPINRDSDFDNGVIYHEYGHGVSNRLTNGPADASALFNLQSGGMGEGWSDFWALMFTQKTTDQKNDSYGIGNYVLFNQPDGPGIRQSPYSFNQFINPMTFDDYGLVAGASKRDVEVHWTGALWASALWDLNWLLNDKYGFDPDLMTGYDPSTAAGRAGNKLALQLVMDALKLQPANPTFIQARDAILQADLVLTGGQNQREIWTAFARRGLGDGAFTFDSNSFDLTTSFTLPAEAQNPGIIAQSLHGTTNTLPRSLVVTFSESMNTSSFSLADDVVSFTGPGGVNLKSSITGFRWNSTTDLEIFFTVPAGNAAQGEYKLVLAPTILSADDGSPLDQDFDGTAGEATEDRYTAFFQYDAIALTATATPVAGAGAVLNVNDSILVTFSEPVAPATLGIDDIALSQGTVVGFQQVAPNQVRYDIAGMNEAQVYMTMKYGAVLDPYGFSVQAFNADFPVEIGVAPLPTPLKLLGPLGWQSYEGSAPGRVDFRGDVDTYTLDLDAGTQLTMLADQLAGIRASITVTGPLGNVVGTALSPAASAPAATPTIDVATAGTYTIQVTAIGRPIGAFRIRALVGTLTEDELTSDIPNQPSAESIDSRMIDLGGGASGISVLGQVGRQVPLPGTSDPEDNFSFTVAGGQPISVGLERLSSGAGTLPTIELLSGSTPVGTLTSPTNYFQAINFVTPAGAPQTYTIRVSGTATAAVGHDYLVSVVRNGVMDAEANNTSAAAQSLPVGSTARGGLLAGDEDWYEFTLAGPTVLHLTTATPSDGPLEYQNTLDPVIELWDSSGTSMLASNDNGLDGRNALLVTQPLAAGNYRIRVAGATPTTTGEYTLFVDGSANPAPIGVSPGGPYAISEGDSLVLSASAFDPNGDTLTYGWDLNGDGVFTDAAGQNVAVTWAALQALNPPVNDGPRVLPVRVRVSDGTSATTSEATTLTVENTVPTATFALLGSASTEIDPSAGDTEFALLNAFDPSAADTTAGLLYSFDFDNNGSFDDPGDVNRSLSSTASIAYQTAGPRTVRARIEDKDGGFTEYTMAINVLNVPPSASITPIAPVAEGGTAKVSVTATHPFTATTAAGFTYSYDLDGDGKFDLGDGLTYAGSVPQSVVDVPPGLLDDGDTTRTVRVRVFEVTGLFTDAFTTIDVLNVAPNATFTGPTGRVEVQTPVTFSFSGVVDPSATDTASGFLYSFDLNNDGDFLDPGEALNSASPSLAAEFPLAGSYTIRGRVADKNGGFTDHTVTVTVAPLTKTFFAAGVDAGNAPLAKLYDSTGALKLNSAVFGPEAIGGVRVAVGDVNGDGTPDLIAGTGPGSRSEVRILDGRTGEIIFSAQPFGEFTGGVFVAAGDIDGDGLADFAVSPDESGGPRVVVYNSRNRGQVASFFAIDDPNFRGGARVAMADVTGDGLADLLVAAGFGGGPRVAGFDARFLTTTRQKIFNDFFAFAPTLRNGVYIAGGDMNGDGLAEVVVGAGPGGGPQVMAFSGAGLLNDQLVPLADFFAGDSANRGGVRVAVTDYDGDRRADIITGEATGPRLNIYLAADIPSTGRPLDALELLPFSAPMNGIFVG